MMNSAQILKMANDFYKQANQLYRETLDHKQVLRSFYSTFGKRVTVLPDTVAFENAENALQYTQIWGPAFSFKIGAKMDSQLSNQITAFFKTNFPSIYVVGIEPDPENAQFWTINLQTKAGTILV